MPAWEGGPQLGSSKVAAKTRQQLLEEAHADRDARKTERLKHQCATRIQSGWRTYQGRVFAVRTVCPRVFSSDMPTARAYIAAMATWHAICRSARRYPESLEMPCLSLEQLLGLSSLCQHATSCKTSSSSSRLYATGIKVSRCSREGFRVSVKESCRLPCLRHSP